jgi:di/tricarboxylate transporter
VVPVALAAAEDIQPSPDPVLLLLALGASITPISPINSLLMPDGKSGFSDIICGEAVSYSPGDR